MAKRRHSPGIKPGKSRGKPSAGKSSHRDALPKWLRGGIRG